MVSVCVKTNINVPKSESNVQHNISRFRLRLLLGVDRRAVLRGVHADVHHHGLPPDVPIHRFRCVCGDGWVRLGTYGGPARRPPVLQEFRVQVDFRNEVLL